MPGPDLVDPLRWARRNGWRPRYPRTRRDGLHTWKSPDGRLTVRVDIAGCVQVYQHLPGVGVVRVLEVSAGCWQQVLDALTIHSILPARFSTAYLAGVRDATGLPTTRAQLRAANVAATDKTGKELP